MKKTGIYISASYSDEENLLRGLNRLKEKKMKIVDVFTPFPVHGLDKLMGYRRSWLPRVGFIGGAIGAACGFGFQAWVFTRAYPLVFGGKPYLAIPSFIPVTFECTVLFAAFAMVFAFLIRSGLGPGAKNRILDERITDDRFVVLIDEGGEQEKNHDNLKKILGETGGEILETISVSKK